MKKQSLYSAARPSARPSGVAASPAATAPTTAAQAASAPELPPSRLRRAWRSTKAFGARHERAVTLALGAALALGIVLGHHAMQPEPQNLTQKDIDAAVIHVLEKTPLPSQATRAANIIGPSVVRVRGFVDPAKLAAHIAEKTKEAEKSGKTLRKKIKPKALKKSENDESGVPEPDDGEIGVGSGVVIMENGTILTNLHVVAGADKIKVTFQNGLESDAELVSVRPEHDLAVIKAKTLPDDLPAATMRSTNDLYPGDLVVAVGFPFGIGPSVSAGVVSGLKREFRSPEGKRILTNLIQFDAPANPGNSGGPLVTSEGEVVGIVTGILNPTGQRVSIGISFAVPIENAASALGMHPF